MTDVSTPDDGFSQISEEFHRRVERIVWCSVATTDRQGRLRSRILHPVWEGSTGWTLTGRHTLKTKHLEKSPWVSLSYWDPEHKQVYADCHASWEDDADEKARIWKLFESTPEPYGWNPALFWQGGPTDPTFGALKLTPWRIELSGIYEMAQGEKPIVWRNEHVPTQ